MTRAVLVPELLVSDIGRSLDFYVGLIGFSVLYDRPEDGFAYLDLDGAQIMLETAAADDQKAWWTAPAEPPYGRGVNFQIEVRDAAALCRKVVDHGFPLYKPMADAWYRKNCCEVGNRQFLVQDPDGYLLRLFSDLGTRPLQNS